MIDVFIRKKEAKNKLKYSAVILLTPWWQAKYVQIYFDILCLLEKRKKYKKFKNMIFVNDVQRGTFFCLTNENAIIFWFINIYAVVIIGSVI